MKKIILITLLIFPIITFSQNAKIGTLKYLDEKKGFKDIILGNDIASLDGRILPYNDSTAVIIGVKFYIVTDKKLLSIGDNIQINKILVCCFKDKINAIMLSFNKQYGENVKAAYLAAYGNISIQPNQYLDIFYWFGKNTVLNIDLTGTIENSSAFIDQNLQKEIKSFQEQQAKNTVDKL